MHSSCVLFPQVLAVPAASPTSASASSAPVAPVVWPLAELAAVKSLAPVMDVAVVPDMSGRGLGWFIPNPKQTITNPERIERGGEGPVGVMCPSLNEEVPSTLERGGEGAGKCWRGLMGFVPKP